MNSMRYLKAMAVLVVCASSAYGQTATPFNPVGAAVGMALPTNAAVGAPGQLGSGNSASSLAPGLSASPASTVAPGRLKRAAPPPPDFFLTGFIEGNTLTVTSVASRMIRIGTILSGPGIPIGTRVIGFGTGTGGAGTYIIQSGL